MALFSKKYSQQSLGIGLTSRCNLDCQHCYSKNLAKGTISLKQIESILKRFPNLKQVNFGTGESGLNPELLEIINSFKQKNIKIALTTNGTTITNLGEKYLKMISEVDVSIDFPFEHQHDYWRGKEGIFNMAIAAIEKCKKNDIEISIATVLMNINYKFFEDFRKLLDKYGVFLRVNLYKPVNTDKYQLDYEEFWEAMRIIFKNFILVSNSEPILSIITPLANGCGSPCGDSLRIQPDLSISPCVYLDGNKISYKKFNKLKKIIPEFCKKCKFVETCRGGCLSRRILEGRINEPDNYCPFYRGDKLPDIKLKKTEQKDFIHSNYLCTFILK